MTPVILYQHLNCPLFRLAICISIYSFNFNRAILISLQLLRKMWSSLPLTLFFIAPLLWTANAYQGELAIPAIQHRATYNGGWPLGIPGDTCPTEAPTLCGGGDAVTNCCPQGQFCFGDSPFYCCPTSNSPHSFPLLHWSKYR
jgi:hypothetical protein